MNKSKIGDLYLNILIIIIVFIAPLINSNPFLRFMLLLSLMLLLFIEIDNIKILELVRFSLAIFLLIFFGGIYLFNFNSGYFESFNKDFIYFNLFILFLMVFRLVFRNEKRRERLLKVLVLLGTLISLYCLFEYILQRNILFTNYFEDKNMTNGFNPYYRVSGTLNHPIPMSTFSMTISLLSFYLAKLENNRKYYFSLIFNLLAMLLTFTRSAIIVAIGIFLLYITLIIFNLVRVNKKTSLRKILRNTIKSVLIIFFLVFLVNFIKIGNLSLFELIKNRFLEITTTQDSGSFYQRYYGIQFVSNEMFNDSTVSEFLIGHGFGRLNFDLRYNDKTIYGENFYLIDNQYFTLFYNIGFLGIIIVVLLIVVFIFKYFSVTFYKSNNFSRDIVPFITVIGILLHMFFYEGLTYITTVLMLGTSLCICFSKIDLINSLTNKNRKISDTKYE